jgi:hypothetical protein
MCEVEEVKLLCKCIYQYICYTCIEKHVCANDTEKHTFVKIEKSTEKEAAAVAKEFVDNLLGNREPVEVIRENFWERANKVKDWMVTYADEIYTQLDGDAERVLAELAAIREKVVAIDTTQPLDFFTVEGRFIASANEYRNELQLEICEPAPLEDFEQLIKSGLLALPRVEINLRKYFVDFEHLDSTIHIWDIVENTVQHKTAENRPHVFTYWSSWIMIPCGEFLICGGWENGVSIRRTETYNVELNMFTAKQGLIQARSDHGLAVYNGRVYAFSGYSNLTNEYYDLIAE